MTQVKSVAPQIRYDAELHVAQLVGKLMFEVRDVFAAEDWDGLRQSHFRLIANVPSVGVSVTELAQAVRMSKQACGQFVTQLVATGHLAIRADATDRRVRLVIRTPLGHRTHKAANARIRRIEREWARRVGADRYATFREVLEELSTGRS
ncbi:MAG: MarR family transcriptional regulator [Sporichthyaceae bacterium]